MSDLAFLENYKTIRQKFRPVPVAVAHVPKPVEVVPPPVIQYPDDNSNLNFVAKHGTKHRIRDMAKDRRQGEEEALEQGISYRQSLLKTMPASRPRYKLAVLFVLEEHAMSWDDLFDGTRELYKSIIRWKVFRALKEEGMKLLQIAQLCRMDHTSVMHGLKKLAQQETNDGHPNSFE